MIHINETKVRIIPKQSSFWFISHYISSLVTYSRARRTNSSSSTRETSHALKTNLKMKIRLEGNKNFMKSNNVSTKSLKTYRRTSITTRASRTSSTSRTLSMKDWKRVMDQAKIINTLYLKQRLSLTIVKAKGDFYTSRRTGPKTMQPILTAGY